MQDNGFCIFQLPRLRLRANRPRVLDILSGSDLDIGHVLPPGFVLVVRIRDLARPTCSVCPILTPSIMFFSGWSQSLELWP